ncbi:hypothetical protein TNCV_3223151 [Trichonephila clavipes]|nr:hypothetical protein TNCV_3223151 [Trichonephila clavipes]
MYRHLRVQEDGINSSRKLDASVKAKVQGDQVYSPYNAWGCGCPVVKESDHGSHVMSSSPVPPKTRRLGQRCTLNLPRAETSSHRCGVVALGESSGVVHVT